MINPCSRHWLIATHSDGMQFTCSAWWLSYSWGFNPPPPGILIIIMNINFSETAVHRLPKKRCQHCAGYGLVSSRSKAWPGPMLTKLHVAPWRHLGQYVVSNHIWKGKDLVRVCCVLLWLGRSWCCPYFYAYFSHQDGNIMVAML